MRPSREGALMAMAIIVASRGTCDRKQVGAIIAKEGRIVSTGFNGAPPGLPHCDANNHGYPDAIIVAKEVACRNATHAEANALAFAARYGVSTDDADLFVTVSPCLDCARLLIAAGIRNVYFNELYREVNGLELLSAALIPSAQL
jgi:dCMP deaminase